MRYLYVFILFFITGCGDEQTPQVVEPNPPLIQKEVTKKIEPEERTSTKEELAAKLKFTINNSADEAEKLPEVTFSDDNIQTIVRGAGKGLEIDPLAISEYNGNCLAKRLKKGKKTTIWQPKWYFYGAGKLMIPQIKLSHDKSVIAFIEQIGSQNGPFGSRVVLMSTYTWETIAVHTFKDKKISKFEFGANDTIYLYTESQKELKQKSTLIKYNLRLNTITEKQHLSLSDLSYIKGLGLCVKFSGSKKLQLFADESFDDKFDFTTKNSEGIIAANSGKILLYGDKKLETFKPGIAWPQKSVPIEYRATKATIMDADKQSLFLTQNDELVLQVKNHFRKITDKVNGTLFYDKYSGKLFIEKSLKSLLEIYSLPDLLLVESVRLPDIRPRTKGNVLLINYLPHQEKYVVFDSFGNLYLFYQKKDRWSKIILLEAKK